MEYAAVADLGAPPARNVALSIFASSLDNRRVYTARGAEAYEVMLAGDTSGYARDIRDTLDAISRDRELYAFRPHDSIPLHSAAPKQRDAALLRLADVGWRLYSAIFSKDSRAKMALEIEGDRSTIHVAHSLLEHVIPWAAIYDRPYNSVRKKDQNGLPVIRGVCPAGFPGNDGKFLSEKCGTQAICPLSPEWRADQANAGLITTEDTTVCARHFWGFRNKVELPPYQDKEPAPMTTIAICARTGSPRRDMTVAGTPFNVLMGLNYALITAEEHRTELISILGDRKHKAVCHEQSEADAFLVALQKADADLVYLFCHARGGLADPATKIPTLELQEPAGAPSFILRETLASGVDLTHHPLVILNGCNTAAFSPDALSPFIRNLVRDCAAAGVLGTEIPVFEVLAGEVARQFLTRFLDDRPAGEALLDVRRDLIARGNPLGLAYTLYAVSELGIRQ
jgi:CHAT domain